MPFVLLVFGILFLVVSIRGTQGQFFALLKSEFVGTNSFVVWGSALLILGMIGYIRPIRPAAQAMMGLVLLVIVLANKGFFAQFNQAIRDPVGGQAPVSGQGSVVSGQTATGAAGVAAGSAGADAASAPTSTSASGGTGSTGSNIYDASGNWIGVGDPSFPQGLSPGQYFGA